MKKLWISFLLLCCFNTYAQKSSKVDSVYYLLDTSKTSVNDRMWQIGIEGKDKYYTILCPCLQYQGKPTFIYRDTVKGEILTKKKLSSRKFAVLPELILKAKEFLSENYKGKIAFFLIEPAENNFISHRVFLLKPQKPFITDSIQKIRSDTNRTKKL